MTRLSEAAGLAPHSAGVYFFLDRRNTLLYVGMAKDLRRRLQQHARAARGALYRRVADVRWEELFDEDAAAAREADLIVALQPPFNASIAGDGKWAFIHVRALPRSARLRFALSKNIEAATGTRVYGCFPHLGAGVGALPGIACSDGYCAFLRLLWAASGEGEHFPGRITRGSPPETFDVAVDPGVAAPLHDFLVGTSRRLLVELAIMARQRDAYMQVGLARDFNLAGRFFEYGPRAQRTLRLRHGLRPAAITRPLFEDLLLEEVRDLIGAPEFVTR
jgi:predicted GIY-YIG superfamily endonuclease